MSPDTSDGPQSPQSPAPQAGPQSPAAGAQAPPPPPPPGGGLAAPQAPAGQAFAPPAVGVLPLSGVGKRLGEYLLECVLFLFTLGIGWIVWTLIILGRGQTPAKQLLHMRVVDAQTGQLAGYGTMLLREVLGKWVVGIVAGLTVIGLILYFWLCWDDRNQQLWDKMAGTVVVDDPTDSLAPA